MSACLLCFCLLFHVQPSTLSLVLLMRKGQRLLCENVFHFSKNTKFRSQDTALALDLEIFSKLAEDWPLRLHPPPATLMHSQETSTPSLKQKTSPHNSCIQLETPARRLEARSCF